MIGAMTDTPVPNAPCPACGYKMDRAASVTGPGGPQEGDCTICINFSEILIFDRKLRTRRPTDAEMIALQRGHNWPTVQKAVMATRMVKARRHERQAKPVD